MSRPLAALTGATGFLGRWVACALNERGFDLRILAGRDPVCAQWADLEPEVVFGRLGDAAALARLTEGAEVTVHVAGLIKARRQRQFTQINVEGARGVAEAVRASGPAGRMLLVSSLSAREPHLSHYAASKAAGEAAAREVLPADRITVVRPPAVYGPGDRETLAFFQAARSLPLLPLVGPEHARFAMIHVADAADQIADLAGRPADGGAYALADARPSGYGWRELMQTGAAAMGRLHPGFVRLPAALTLAIGAASAGLGRLAGSTPILTPGKARELLHPDWSIAAADLPPAAPPCRFDLAAGFADTVRWYYRNAWL